MLCSLSAKKGLAHVDSSSVRPAVVYDAECAFCRGQIARIQARDRNGTFEYVPRQTPELLRRFPRLAKGDFNTGMRLVAPDGHIFVGADAVYQIARALRPWSWVAWLYRVPGLHALARWAYAWVAAHRKSLSRCENGSCERNG